MITRKFIVCGIALFVLANCLTPAVADWNTGDPAKWVQMPDLSSFGMDVLNAPSSGYTFKFQADDFVCTQSGPITDIHVWGSYWNDQNWSEFEGVVPTFSLAIYDNIPAGPTQLYSKPGNLLWSWNGVATERLYATGPEDFYDPNLNQIVGSDTQVWQYNFNIPAAKRFSQEQGKVYWLGITRSPDINGDGIFDATDYTYWDYFYTSGLHNAYGWKTSQEHWNDDAVFTDVPIDLWYTQGTGQYVPEPSPTWQDMHYPAGHAFAGQSIDLAFVINGVPEPGSLVMLGGLGIVFFIGYLRRKAR
jgi:hypothetical protein